MANDSATPKEQCIAHQDPHETSDSHPSSQNSRDPRNWISAQQAIEEIEIEMNRFLSARYSTQIVSTGVPIINMCLYYSDVAPTEIDNEFSTSSTDSVRLIANYDVPGTFLYTPENMRSLCPKFRLSNDYRSVQIHPDPARTPRTQIQDIPAFKRRCPYVRVDEEPDPNDSTEWCLELMSPSGEIIYMPLNPVAFVRHSTCT